MPRSMSTVVTVTLGDQGKTSVVRSPLSVAGKETRESGIGNRGFAYSPLLIPDSPFHNGLRTTDNEPHSDFPLTLLATSYRLKESKPQGVE